jgi:hypothetical protein
MHEFSLRRSLLNSCYYDESVTKRFYHRFIAYNKVLLGVSSVGTAFVIVFLFTVSATAQGENWLPFLSSGIEIQTVEAASLDPAYMQELYEYGYLQYSHTEDTGCRVYKAADEQMHVQVRDEMPYTIETVLVH